MPRKKKDLIPWLIDNGYKWVQKYQINMFICTKEDTVKADSIFDEYKMYKYEILDIPMGELIPLVRM